MISDKELKIAMDIYRDSKSPQKRKEIEDFVESLDKRTQQYKIYSQKLKDLKGE